MIPAYWNRPGLCAGTAGRDWDTVAATVATTVSLRDRSFPRACPADTRAALRAFLATPHGPRLPIWTAVEDDGDGGATVIFWSTHAPSVEEFCRQFPECRVEYQGDKAELARTVRP